MQDFSVPGPAGHMLLFEVITVPSPEAGFLEESCAGCGEKYVPKYQLSLRTGVLTAMVRASRRSISSSK